MNTLTVRTNPAPVEVLAERAKAMLKVEDMCKSQVQWYQTKTVSDYRKLRAEGIGFPKPWLYKEAKTVTISGRDGNEIPLRVVQATPPTKGVLLHFHAGLYLVVLLQGVFTHLTFLLYYRWLRDWFKQVLRCLSRPAVLKTRINGRVRRV